MNISDWVVDIGAFDHMLRSNTMFEKFDIGDKELTVLMADGIVFSVLGKWNVCVAGLQLESVLYVPNLKCNLLSMSKLTRDMDGIVTFFPLILYLPGPILGEDD